MPSKISFAIHSCLAFDHQLMLNPCKMIYCMKCTGSACLLSLCYDFMWCTFQVSTLCNELKLKMVMFHSRVEHGFKYGDLFMSFKSVFQDIRNAVDFVHMQVKCLFPEWGIAIPYVELFCRQKSGFIFGLV